MRIKPIIIVGGEPYGIFLEIFFKSIHQYKFKRPLLLIASINLVKHQMRKLKINKEINLIALENVLKNKLSLSKINIIDINYKTNATFKSVSKKSNIYINDCFNVALNLIKNDISDRFINGPISKKKFLHGKFLGITEYLANKANIKKFAMLIFNEKLSVSPLTTHLPLKNVHKNLSKKKIIDHVELINIFYKKKFNKIPKIAITGLNPHCESNFLNSEEDRIIIPTIKLMKDKKYKVYGPFAADTIFIKDNYKKYDVIIGMYHDQVLGPMKAIFEFDAINITLGLPYTRISPDHGPNFSMFGKNLSNHESLLKALIFLDK